MPGDLDHIITPEWLEAGSVMDSDLGMVGWVAGFAVDSTAERLADSTAVDSAEVVSMAVAASTEEAADTARSNCRV